MKKLIVFIVASMILLSFTIISNPVARPEKADQSSGTPSHSETRGLAMEDANQWN